jgi:hypothetical protein
MPTTEDQKFYHPRGEEKRYLEASEAVQHIVIPENPNHIPMILGWAGPGRCGSTALLLLLAGHPEVNRAYYQPEKSIIRNGGPDFVLHEGDRLVVTKEVFGPRADQEYYDAAGILLKAGVPPEKMVWIMMLRDPVLSFASWYNFTGIDSSPERFAKAQQHTIDLYHRYKAMGLKVFPFVYELLALGEENVLKILLQRTGLNLYYLSLEYDLKALGITKEGDYDNTNTDSKMVWGEALKSDHWQAVIKPTVSAGRYQYTTSDSKVKRLPSEWRDEVDRLCRNNYQFFLSLTKKWLGF